MKRVIQTVWIIAAMIGLQASRTFAEVPEPESRPLSEAAEPVPVDPSEVVPETPPEPPAREGLLGLPEWMLSEKPVPENPLPKHWTLFPAGDTFLPLLADPKQPRTELALQRQYLPGPEKRLVGVFFLGDTFGFVRHTWKDPADPASPALQISVQGMANPQVGYEDPYRGNLLYVDFFLGTQASFSWNRWSLRTRYYHQSSHAGDEFIRKNPAFVPIGLSYEAVEFIGAWDSDWWRVYGGGGVRTHIRPSWIKRADAHVGVEFRSPHRFFYIGRFVAGYDLKMHEINDFAPEHSFVVGTDFGEEVTGRRRFKVLFHYFHGKNFYGEFFRDHLVFYALALRFSL